MSADQPLPILRARPSQIAERVLVVGEPARAQRAAETLLENPQEVGSYREYLTLTGTFNGMPITVCSHGVGAGGASVAFHELFQAGAKKVIRGGTCGAARADINDGDFIIATGAIRDEGASESLVPMSYPAVADYRVVNALLTASANHGRTNPPTGIVRSAATFYPGLLDRNLDLWLHANIVALEMELAILLVMAGVRGLQAGGIFVSDGNMVRDRERKENLDNTYDPHRQIVKQGTDTMLRVAVEALAML
ncbi:MAG: nucleoside phosphorylase [Anaerolineae bacterium]|nr:nucleoside phosphorylase [Anaerolineae bacterium]